MSLYVITGRMWQAARGALADAATVVLDASDPSLRDGGNVYIDVPPGLKAHTLGPAQATPIDTVDAAYQAIQAERARGKDTRRLLDVALRTIQVRQGVHGLDILNLALDELTGRRGRCEARPQRPPATRPAPGPFDDLTEKFDRHAVVALVEDLLEHDRSAVVALAKVLVQRHDNLQTQRDTYRGIVLRAVEMLKAGRRYAQAAQIFIMLDDADELAPLTGTPLELADQSPAPETREQP